MGTYQQFGLGEKVRIYSNGRKIHTTPEAVNRAVADGVGGIYPATIIGTSEHIVKDKATKHVILGWKENPFPSLQMPDEVQIDSNIPVNDTLENYRYKAFMPPDGFCEPCKDTRTQPAEEAKTVSTDQPALPHKMADAKLGDTVKVKVKDLVVEGVVIATGHSFDTTLLGFTKSATLPEQAYDGQSYTTGNPWSRLTNYREYIQTPDTDQYVASKVVVSDDLCEIVPAQPKIGTLRDAKLGDRIKVEIGGKMTDATVMAVKPKGNYTQNWALVAFEAEALKGIPDAIPCFPITKDGDFGTGKGSYERYIDDWDRFAACKTTSLDAQCEVLYSTDIDTGTTYGASLGGLKALKSELDKAVESEVLSAFDGYSNYALKDAKNTADLFSGVINTFIPNNMAQTITLADGCSVVLNQPYVGKSEQLLQPKLLADLKTALGIAGIISQSQEAQPTDPFASFKSALKTIEGAVNKIAADMPEVDKIRLKSELDKLMAIDISAKRQKTPEEIAEDEAAAKKAEADAYFKAREEKFANASFKPTNRTIDEFEADQPETEEEETKPIDIIVPKKEVMTDTPTPQVVVEQELTPAPKQTTLADAKMGDRVVVEYNGYSIEGTIVGTDPIPSWNYVLVGYKADEEKSWEGKVVAGRMSDRTTYGKYAPDVEDYVYGTSFLPTYKCHILPKVEPKIEVPEPEVVAEPETIEAEIAKETPISLLAVLGSELFASLMNAVNVPAPSVRVKEEPIEEPIEVVEEETKCHAEVG